MGRLKPPQYMSLMHYYNIIMPLSLYIGNSNVRCGSGSASGMLTDMKTDKCVAYEVITLKQQKVEMKENPAYEEISHYATIS